MRKLKKIKKGKIAASIEARMGSTRLPGKTTKLILGKPMLELMIERVKKAALVDEIVIATSVNKNDNVLENLAKKNRIRVFRGSENDVLDRVLKAAEHCGAEHIVELWGDCPLIDPEIIDKAIRYYMDNDFDCVGTLLDRKFPWGIAALIFQTKILREISQVTQDPVDRENVSNYIYEHPGKYRIGHLPCPPELNRPEIRLTVDELADFDLVKTIFERMIQVKPDFRTTDIIKFLDSHPEIKNINTHVKQKKLSQDTKGAVQ